jgi:hypothetical protein
MTTMADVPLFVVSEYSSSERRITPAWSIAQLKKKMEPITGIPPPCQKITLKTATNTSLPVEAVDEEAAQLANFPLVPYAELHVSLSIRYKVKRVYLPFAFYLTVFDHLLVSLALEFTARFLI